MIIDNEDNSSVLDQYTDKELAAHELSPRDARALLFQMLYAAEAFDYTVSLESITDNFYRGFNISISSTSPLFTKAQAIITQREELDASLKPLLTKWRWERLGLSTRLILRLALWELLNTDTPALVVINEAVELGKCFAELDAYKFINGILDEWIKRNQPERAHELAGAPDSESGKQESLANPEEAAITTTNTVDNKENA